MFFLLVGTADCRLIGISDGPVFDLMTSNLFEIDSIPCDDGCGVGDGDGGFSKVLDADAKASPLQISKNSIGCNIEFENAQLRKTIDCLLGRGTIRSVRRDESHWGRDPFCVSCVAIDDGENQCAKHRS